MLAYLNRKILIHRKKPNFIHNNFFESILWFFTISLYILNNLNILSNPHFLLTVRQTKQGIFYNMTSKLFGETESFYNYEIIYKLSQANFTNCSLCKFDPDTNGASSKDDLAIAVLFGNKIYNVINWVRTLRSTGCKCKILFFHEPNYIYFFNKNELDALKDCGVVWYPIKNNFINSTLVYDPRTTKWLVIQNFLEAYGNYFKRVLISDVFDTIFQKDPFLNGLPRKKIASSIERVQFGNHETNMMWVQSLDHYFSPRWWRKKWVINSGFLIGPSELMLDLIHTMNQPKYFFAKQTLDQGILNFIYYKGIWKKLWIDLKGEYFISAAYSVFALNGDAQGFMHEYSYSKYTLAVIHQYDRICPITKNLNKVCPRLGSWQRSFGRVGYHMQQCGSLDQANHPPLLK